MVASGKPCFLRGDSGLQRQASRLARGKLRGLLGPSLRSHTVSLTPHSVPYKRGMSLPRVNWRGVSPTCRRGHSKVRAELGGGRWWTLFGTRTPFACRLCVRVGGGLVFSRGNFLSVLNCMRWGFKQRPWSSGGAAGRCTPRWSPAAASIHQFQVHYPCTNKGCFSK